MNPLKNPEFSNYFSNYFKLIFSHECIPKKILFPIKLCICLSIYLLPIYISI